MSVKLPCYKLALVSADGTLDIYVQECRVRCTECNGARAGCVACSVFDIWEGQECGL